MRLQRLLARSSMPSVVLLTLACGSSSDGQNSTNSGSGGSGGSGVMGTSGAQGGTSSSATDTTGASATTGSGGDTGSSSATSNGTGTGGSGSGGEGDSGGMGGTSGEGGASTSVDGTTDAGSGGTAGAASCDGIRGSVEDELARVATCQVGDSCEYNFIGTGCTDSPLPCCGFPNRVGADLSVLTELDDSYREQSCAGDALACCACPMPPPLECIDGVCTAQ